MQGEVVAVGPGARDDAGKVEAPDVKSGDIVLFGKWSGSEVKIDGEDLLIMKESDILGMIEGKASVKLPPSPHFTKSKHSWSSPKWQPKTSSFLKMPAIACCAASISSPMR